MIARLRRWKYLILTFRDHAARLNRSVEVENVLLDCAAGRRPPIAPDDCRQLAYKLGVPNEFRVKP